MLTLWSEYVDVIYMPDSEVNIIDAVNKSEARPEDESFAAKTEEKDIRNRMDILFGRDDKQNKL